MNNNSNRKWFITDPFPCKNEYKRSQCIFKMLLLTQQTMLRLSQNGFCTCFLIPIKYRCIYRHFNQCVLALTSSHRMPYKPAHFCWDGRSVSVYMYTRIPIFVCFAGRLVSTPSFLGVPGGHSWVALQAMNEFTLFVDFCLIPLSKTCAFDVSAKNL